MKITIKLALLSVITLSACGSDDIPFAADLPRRSPVLNSAPIDQDPRAVAGGYIASEIPSSIPSPFPSQQDVPSAFPPIGGGFQAPEPPAFIGSQSAQPFPSAQPQSIAIPQAPSYSPILPTSSPVDISAAEISAAGLPVQRRAPAFNQANLGVMPEGAQVMLDSPQIQPLSQIQTAPVLQAPQIVQIPQVPQIPQPPFGQVQFEAPQITVPQPQLTIPEVPQIAYADNEGFPRLSQIPTAQIQTPRIDSDPRVQQLRDDLNSISEPATNFAALKPLPNEPLYKIAEPTQQFAQPALQPIAQAPIRPVSQPSLAPLPPAILQPGYSPSYAPVQRSPQIAPALNFTNLSDLRPIGSGSGQSSILLRGRSYKNTGDVSRHSTRGGY